MLGSCRLQNTLASHPHNTRRGFGRDAQSVLFQREALSVRRHHFVPAGDSKPWPERCNRGGAGAQRSRAGSRARRKFARDCSSGDNTGAQSNGCCLQHGRGRGQIGVGVAERPSHSTHWRGLGKRVRACRGHVFVHGCASEGDARTAGHAAGCGHGNWMRLGVHHGLSCQESARYLLSHHRQQTPRH